MDKRQAKRAACGMAAVVLAETVKRIRDDVEPEVVAALCEIIRELSRRGLKVTVGRDGKLRAK
jgi:hypothetical protein